MSNKGLGKTRYGENAPQLPVTIELFDALYGQHVKARLPWVVGHRLDRQPGGVGGEAARGEMIQPDAVLEVPDGVLDLGVAAMVGLQFQGVSPSRPVMKP